MPKMILIVALWLLSTVALAKELGMLVEVLSADAIPLTGVNAAQNYLAKTDGLLKVYSFDGARKLEGMLSEGMEAMTEAEAKRLLQRKMDRMGSQVMQGLAEKSYMAILLANRFKIDRYPAVIINRKQVIYGVTDIMDAINHSLAVAK